MFSKFHNRERGFTLIELMIVVVIIGILAALAIPRFMQATTKSKQSECKGILKQVYTMQHAYRQANNAYGDNGVTAAASGSFPTLGIEVMAAARYSYVMTAAQNTFTCVATANLDDDGAIDTWQIDQTGALTCTIDDVTAVN
jgi:type IV pilus assembly protein PilA